MLGADAIIELLELHPLEVEGGQFRRTWVSAETSSDGRPIGTAIYALFTDDPDSFSALHRLDAEEVWHHYFGAPLVLHLFDTQHREVMLGSDLAAGYRPQVVVPAGCWMGAHVNDGADVGYTLIGCTMSPGFVGSSYQGGRRDDLVAAYPDAVAVIHRLTRPGLEVGRPSEM